MILIDIRRPHAVPLFDPLTHLVFSTAKSDVRHVFVGGRQVVRDGALDRRSTSSETLDEVTALAPRIAASLAHEPAARAAGRGAGLDRRAGRRRRWRWR